MASTCSEERNQEEEAKEKMVHKTKAIQFLGRTTPIILQNDNGPCPLLAICNVLLLKNQLKLSPDIAEVSQEKLLSLVAEWLIDSNSNVHSKEEGFIVNQQQNIADAIDLLPRLTTGIDVNIKFRRIDDFEFTPECAIFDLLDIPLYHGWIVDPQDYDTAKAIGSKSYNALMSELVVLETESVDSGHKKNYEEDCVDFVAATAATQGIPSPCLLRGRSIDDSPRSISSQCKPRKGDIEEEAELLRVLKLSEAEKSTSMDGAPEINHDDQNSSVSVNENAYLKKSEPVIFVESLEENAGVECQKSCQHEPPMFDDSNVPSNHNNDQISYDMILSEVCCSSLKIDQENPTDQSGFEHSGGHTISNDVDEKMSFDVAAKNESTTSNSSSQDPSSCESDIQISRDVQIQNQSTSKNDVNKLESKQSGCDTVDISTLSTPSTRSESFRGTRLNTDVSETFTSGIDSSKPIYEGEECISRTAVFEDREPVYKGKVVLAGQLDRGSIDSDINCKAEMTPKQGDLIRKFLKNSASQLTVYGLFCLQDGLKERELCVFFHNNHFSTLFKHERELHILATDEGYINQPGLVWEKLNEVNGDTVYMTGDFKEFKVENHAGDSWDENNSMDYLGSVNNPEHTKSSFNSDLQLAIALQQQEFEQQPEFDSQQSDFSSGSRLVTGPQVTRHSAKVSSSSSSSKQNAKSTKEWCVIM